jgi:hypothetical protein
MVLASSILAYSDCKAFMEAALDDTKGARLPFRTETDANYWRMRCNYFRRLNREENALTYDLGHKMHGRSEYDKLTMTIKQSGDGWWWVYAEKRAIDLEAIEPLSEVPEPEPLEIEAEEVRLLGGPNDDENAA